MPFVGRLVRDRAQLLYFYRDNLASGWWTEKTINEEMRTIDTETMRRINAQADM